MLREGRSLVSRSTVNFYDEWFVTSKNGDTVIRLIESREEDALADLRVFIGTRQTQRLRGSVALPTMDNPSSGC